MQERNVSSVRTGFTYPAIGKCMFISRTLNKQEFAFRVEDTDPGAKDGVVWMQFYELFFWDHVVLQRWWVFEWRCRGCAWLSGLSWSRHFD
jgi:hypothetical protein